MHFREEDLYCDKNGKIRKIAGAILRSTSDADTSVVENALTRVNPETFNLFVRLESIFKHQIETLAVLNENLESRSFSLMSGVTAEHIPNCHGMKEKLIKRFIEFRLKINRTKLMKDKRYDSKSMALRNVS